MPRMANLKIYEWLLNQADKSPPDSRMRKLYLATALYFDKMHGGE